MKPFEILKSAPLVLFALVLAVLVVPPAAAGPLTDAERQSLLDHLDRTRDLFLGEISGLTEEQWTYKAAPDRWSIAECSDHILKSESFLRGAIEGVLETPATPEQIAQGGGKEEQILTFIVDRSKKFQAPEGLRPAAEALEADAATVASDFEKERALTSKLAAEGGDLRAFAGPHPAFEQLDALGWVYFLSGHTERHTLQIQEVKADPGFPKS